MGTLQRTVAAAVKVLLWLCAAYHNTAAAAAAGSTLEIAAVGGESTATAEAAEAAEVAEAATAIVLLLRADVMVLTNQQVEQSTGHARIHRHARLHLTNLFVQLQSLVR